jgi:acyl-CoA thioesterase-1
MIDMKPRTALLALALLTTACDRADTRDAHDGAGDAATASDPAATSSTGNARDTRGVVLFLGTSLTAGFGVGTENAWPAVIQDSIDAARLPYRVVNAGLSGETSAGGLRRLEWSLQEPIEALVLELGANDGLRGLPVDDMRANLDSILTRTRRRYPDATLVIAGMQAPPNLGSHYTAAFTRTYSDLAEKHGAALVPFLLEGVGGRPELNQDDGIHPTAAGHAIMAANAWRVLGPRLMAKAGDGNR